MNRTRSEVVAEAEEFADVVLKHEPEMSFDEAMSLVWEEVPELYDEYLDAEPDQQAEPIAKAEDDPTVAEVIWEAVQKRAADLAWTQWPAKSLADIELDVWSSPEGASLYELYRSPAGKEPFDDAMYSISKSASHRDALFILERWLS